MDFQALVQAAKTAPRSHLGAVSPMVEKNIRAILEGRWTVDDVLESQVDELSTSGNVGSGTEKPLGGYSREKDQWEKMIRSYEEYLARTRTESSLGVAKKFLRESTPGCRDELVQTFIERLKSRGFRL